MRSRLLRIVSIVLFIGLLASTTAYAGGDPRLSRIYVKCDFQDYYASKGKQKVVLNVTNGLDAIFTGTISVAIKNSSNKTIYRDWLTLDKFGARQSTFAVMWVNSGGTTYTYSVSGSLKSVPVPKGKYEVMQRFGTRYAMTYYVWVPNLDSVEAISKEFQVKGKGASDILKVLFFVDKRLAALDDPECEGVQYDFYCDYSTGLSNIYAANGDLWKKIK